MSLLLLKEIVLITSLIGLVEQDVAVDGVMEHELVDSLFSLEATVFVREFGQVVRCLRVVGVEHLEDHLFLLFLGQILLVHAWHVIVTHDKIVVFLEVVVLIFDLLSLLHGLGLLGSTFGWHFAKFLLI